jgi:lipopolysaccharide/colanic/teichoic acid biosynthesis glycosyltransferase
MRVLVPSSRGSFQLRLSVFDVLWAAASPLLALYLSSAYILYNNDGVWLAILYCSISFTFSLIFFLVFRIRDGMAGHFSVHDAMAVTKAVLFAELITSPVLFTLTRLEGIPRSTPIIHALILGAGLVGARTLIRILRTDSGGWRHRAGAGCENIIVIGSNRQSSLYVQLLEACAPGQHSVVAVLDENPRMVGRAMSGMRIVGAPHNLLSIVDEFAVHGVCTDRVIIGGDADLISEQGLQKVRQICRQRQIRLDFVSELVGLSSRKAAATTIKSEQAEQAAPLLVLPRYFDIKRFIDFFAAAALLAVLSPLFILIIALAVLDVGSPIFFWQQRLGCGGRPFLLYKFRTLRPPFDWRGRPIPENKRISFVGHALRSVGLDELPQLLNVLVGDMSLIGPRPLLPVDQPADPTIRLMVRPGITGWAQVNGAKFLSAAEKDEFDEWYVRHASLWVDLRIILMTIRLILRGPRRLEQAVAQTRRMLPAEAQNRHNKQQPHVASERCDRPRDLPAAASG